MKQKILLPLFFFLTYATFSQQNTSISTEKIIEIDKQLTTLREKHIKFLDQGLFTEIYNNGAYWSCKSDQNYLQSKINELNSVESKWKQPNGDIARYNNLVYKAIEFAKSNCSKYNVGCSYTGKPQRDVPNEALTYLNRKREQLKQCLNNLDNTSNKNSVSNSSYSNQKSNSNNSNYSGYQPKSETQMQQELNQSISDGAQTLSNAIVNSGLFNSDPGARERRKKRREWKRGAEERAEKKRLEEEENRKRNEMLKNIRDNFQKKQQSLFNDYYKKLAQLIVNFKSGEIENENFDEYYNDLSIDFYKSYYNNNKEFYGNAEVIPLIWVLPNSSFKVNENNEVYPTKNEEEKISIIYINGEEFNLTWWRARKDYKFYTSYDLINSNGQIFESTKNNWLFDGNFSNFFNEYGILKPLIKRNYRNYSGVYFYNKNSNVFRTILIPWFESDKINISGKAITLSIGSSNIVFNIDDPSYVDKLLSNQDYRNHLNENRTKELNSSVNELNQMDILKYTKEVNTHIKDEAEAKIYIDKYKTGMEELQEKINFLNNCTLKEYREKFLVEFSFE